MVQSAQRVILVTGPSGAGRTTAINALEDFGYEAIDNMPLTLIPRLLDGPGPDRPMALGLDVRNRDFTVEGVVDLTTRFAGKAGVEMELLYLDCSIGVLVRRYSETRRRHPLAPDASPTEGIEQERALLEPVRHVSDTLIDTTEFSPHDLRAVLSRQFGLDETRALSVTISSFSYKRGLPQGADTVFDCRFLDNPHWEPELRPMTGLDPAVVAHVTQDARWGGFEDRVLDLMRFLLPAYRDEGKSHFSIAFGCTGGRHRSVTAAERASDALAQEGWRVSIRHRELERQGLAGATRHPAPAGVLETGDSSA
ncbi:glmZ(sRNA)-inactivating NTPase [Roseivivax halodurans JCM 10272]|uniref:GlmZ(SRNA)-inactivating NTPase n=1 Tax=Roseivivax halodurans JCM 10272 TaxID=1449350 RepID=X7EFI1_9RHOB|nr:RNase adapter RapZ [Roseivivax halodurans]ETX13956.1 glmZ(sRNA)-inactivating NTPase [Roseivivax halodurans JCM 10272]